jgi:aquaporin TIP
MADFIAAEDLSSGEAWRATLAEFIATLLFVFVGAGAVVATGMVDGGDSLSRLVAIALAHGLTIAILVTATARLSGGHINPAVTIAAIATRKIGLAKGAMYVGGQLAGAIAGAMLLLAVLPTESQGNLGAHALSIGTGEGLIVEMMLTFVLVFVIFATAIDPRGPSHLAPFAIGIAVLVDHFVGVPLTGASMNPARTLGPALASGEWANHWVYWVGPIVGGTVAAVLYNVVYIRGREEEASAA